LEALQAYPEVPEVHPLEALVERPSQALVALQAYPVVQVEHPLEALVERPYQAVQVALAA
jgi:hypothetical protein